VVGHPYVPDRTHRGPPLVVPAPRAERSLPGTRTPPAWCSSGLVWTRLVLIA